MKSRICLTLFFPVVSMWANNTTVDFEKEVFPLFEERCIECHQAPREKNGRLIKPKAGLRMDGLAHLMFGSDDGEQYKVFGVCVTRITALPNFNQCEVILLKGEKRDLWQEELAETIEAVAKENNCKRIAVHARPGWQPFLKTKGWGVKRYLYTKEIK